MNQLKKTELKNPFLIGEKIYLRALNPEDINGNYINWLNDEEVCKNNSHHIFPYTASQAAQFISNVAGSKSELVLAVILKKDNIHIGNISLQKISNIYQNAEFAILFGEKKYWGKGYAKEAAFLLIRHGFNELNLHRVSCGTFPQNIGMQKLADYLGFKKEGQRIQAIFKEGKFIDIIEYGLLKSMFFKKFSI